MGFRHYSTSDSSDVIINKGMEAEDTRRETE